MLRSWTPSLCPWFRFADTPDAVPLAFGPGSWGRPCPPRLRRLGVGVNSVSRPASIPSSPHIRLVLYVPERMPSFALASALSRLRQSRPTLPVSVRLEVHHG
jgi:hypothetical protein